jgi:hypothetical protein
MRVSREGVFKGIEIHRNVLPENVRAQLLTYGETIGKTYAAAGYRGYFEVDCVYTKDKRLLITESNVRRTGGTHVYHTAKRLVGPDFMDQAYILSNNAYPLAAARELTFQDVYNKLQPILFSPETKDGLVIASINGLKYNTFAYIIIGHDKETAYKIEAEMERLLREL